MTPSTTKTSSTMITHGETPPPPHEAKDVVVDGIPVQIAPSVSEETAKASNQDQRLRRRGMLGRCLIGGYFLLVILVTFLPEQQCPLEVTIYVLFGGVVIMAIFLTRMCLTANLASTWAAASLALFGIWKLFLEDEHSCPDIGTCIVFIVLVPYRFVVIVCLVGLLLLASKRSHSSTSAGGRL